MRAHQARSSSDRCRACCRWARSKQWQSHQPETGGFAQAPGLGFQDDHGRRDDLAAITTVKTRSNLCYPRCPTAVSTWSCPRTVPHMSAPHICPNTLEIDMLHPESRYMMTGGVRPPSGPCALHFSAFVLDGTEWSRSQVSIGCGSLWKRPTLTRMGMRRL